MRKILISIFVCLLLVATGFFIVKGNEAINVKGFLGLNEENKELDKKIEELSQVISTGYSNAQTNLETTVDNLLESKTDYETQAVLASTNDSNYTSEMYSIDYLWTRLGNYAKDEQIDMDINVYPTGVEHLYDLKFTLTGSYLGITNFIYDVEDNSKLGFKIDDFSMSGSSSEVTASFSCESIYINIGNAPNPTPTTTTDTSNTTKDSSNTTNTNTTSTETNNTTSTNTTTSKSDADKAYDEILGNTQ